MLHLRIAAIAGERSYMGYPSEFWVGIEDYALSLYPQALPIRHFIASVLNGTKPGDAVSQTHGDAHLLSRG